MKIPRRSVLFMPAVNERAIAKIPHLAVDTVILDLEDAVLPDRKAHARAAAVQALNTLDAGYTEVLVRINGLDTPWWQEDVSALTACRKGCEPAGLVVPKVESVVDLDSIIRAIQDQQDTPLPLWIMLETPRGVLAAAEICAYGALADSPLAGVLLGTADLGKLLGLPSRSDRLGLLNALSQSVMAAKAADLPIIDGVFMDIRDTAGLEAECIQGRALGFDGKTLIHPSQLEVTHRIYSPSEDEFARAQSLIDAWEAAAREGDSGVCVHDNKLVEQLHVEQARDVMAYAELLQNRT